MIYFDNAATSKDKPEEVMDAVLHAMQNFDNSSRGIYAESLSADRTIFNARKKLAAFFHADHARQVVFTKNATESLNIVIQGLFEKGDHVITSVLEHNSVLRPLNYQKQKGVGVSYLKVDADGVLKLSDLEELILPDTKAVILTHASNVVGNINPLDEIGGICKRNHLLFIVDASQTAGAFEIDMERSEIDVLCFTGHKSMLGPQGTGGLCVKKGVHIRPLLSGGTGIRSYDEFQADVMPTALEAGTLNSHGIAGLCAGLKYLEAHLTSCKDGDIAAFSDTDTNAGSYRETPDLTQDEEAVFRAFGKREHRIQSLTVKAVGLSGYFYEEVRKINGIRTYGDFTSRYRAPIVSLNISDMDSSRVSEILSSKYGISTRPGAHCAPLIHKSLGTVDQGMVRFSFSHKNTYEEIDIALEALDSIARGTV